MKTRRRFKQTLSVKDRLASFAKEARVRASLVAIGSAQDDLLKKVRQADTASHILEWVNSPGLQPPK